MQRKLISAILIMTACLCCAFAKTAKVPPSAQLTEQDVISFADEFAAISEDLRGYNYVDEQMNMDDVAKVIGEEEMERVLAAHGISGPERLRKVDMIVLCYAKIKIERELADAPFFMRSAIRKKIKKEFDANINPDDENLVRLHADYLDEKLSPLFEEEEF